MTITAESRRRLPASLEAISVRLRAALRHGGGVCLVAIVLLIGATSGWLEAPLGGVIAGYRVALNGDALPALGPDGTLPLVSFGLLYGLGAILAVCAAIGRAPRWFSAHLAAAMLVGVISFPVIVLTRNVLLLQALTDEGRDREAIRAFAQFVGGYSFTLPPHELAGTATLGDRAYTTFQVLGWGWWVTLAGAVLLLLVSLRRPARRALIVGVAGWASALVLLVAVIALPAVVAEYTWTEADALYAAGQYAEAIARYDDVLRWAPELRENAALRYRRGAAEFWLAGATSAAARGFLAENLRQSGDLDNAVDLVGRGTLMEPGWSWLRHNLAESYAQLGVREARQGEQFGTAAARWLRAQQIDDRLVRLHYYLAHAYHRLHGRDQDQAIGEASELMAVVHDLGIRSDVLALLGDCHFKAERDVEARTLYRKALAAVPLFSQVNLQAQKGLLGL